MKWEPLNKVKLVHSARYFVRDIADNIDVGIAFGVNSGGINDAPIFVFIHPKAPYERFDSKYITHVCKVSKVP